MSTALGQELAALVEPVGAGSGPDTTDLWRAGARRRRWAFLRTAAVTAAVAALVALVVWPGGWQGDAVPADTGQSTDRTYPSVVPQPHFPASLLAAHRPMAAAYVDDQDLYAVDDTGRVWRAPAAPGQRVRAALSGDGRYLSDGWDVYDTVAGTRTRLGPQDGARPVHRAGVAWDLASRRVALVQEDNGEQTAWVGTPQGALLPAPALPVRADQGAFALMVAWLDASRLVALVPAPASAEDPETSRLLAFAWTVQSSDTWDPLGSLTLPTGASLAGAPAAQASVSPDGQLLAVALDVQAAPRRGSSVLTWPVAGLGEESTRPRQEVRVSNLVVDGLSWRGSNVVVSRGGEARVARTDELLSTIGTGSGRPVSWRAGAFDDAAFYNTAAVWRDRLFGWALLLGLVTAVGVLVRVARPVAARAGLLGERYAGPFPLEARWMYSQYLR